MDDFLRLMAQEKSVFLFFFVGIEADASLRMALCSVYDRRLMQPGATIFQHHWAGRATRGVAQFAGKYVMEIIDANPFVNDIDSELCAKFFANHFPDIQYGI